MMLVAAAVAALALGAAPGSWVVEVSTTGGFTGRGSGSVSVGSDGAATCVAPLQCAGPAPADAVRRLAASIASARATTWAPPQSAPTCSDCIVTTLTLHMRQNDGTESRAVFTWNNVEAPQVPAGVKALYDAAIAVAHR